MGFLSSLRGEAPGEPSYSREWIAATRGIPRKTELALAVLATFDGRPNASAQAIGQPLVDEFGFGQDRQLVRDLLEQDDALAAWVARDSCMVLGTLGGLGENREATLQVAGLNSALQPIVNVSEASAGFAGAVAADVIAVASVVAGRMGTGAHAAAGDEAVYEALYSESGPDAFERCVAAASWSAIVCQRLRVAGHVPGDSPVFSASSGKPRQMTADGWYPNPMNAGDTSDGSAEYERYWDGDWTGRVRRKDGRRWEERQQSMYTVPTN